MNEDAQQLAALLSLFALAEIPWKLVQQCLPEVDEEDLEDLRDEQLVNLSLLNYEGEGIYQLHQLLREFFAVKREQRSDVEEMKRSFCGVMAAKASQSAPPLTLPLIEQITVLIPHFKEASTTMQSWLTDDDLIAPSTRIAQFYKGQLEFATSEKWYVHCQSIAEQRFGHNHRAMAISLGNLAELYRLQECYSQAEQLSLRSLKIYEQQLGTEDPGVAIGLSNLALIYRTYLRSFRVGLESK